MISDWCDSVEGTLIAAQAEFLAAPAALRYLPDGESLRAMGEDLLMMATAIPELGDPGRIRAAIDGIDSDGRPASRDDAVLLCASVLGTGTVLDADGIRSEPRANDVPAPWAYEGIFLSPFPETDLEAWFSTAQPDAAQIAEHAERLAGECFRGDGRYVVGYTDGSPVCVLFVGASGD